MDVNSVKRILKDTNCTIQFTLKKPESDYF